MTDLARPAYSVALIVRGRLIPRETGRRELLSYKVVGTRGDWDVIAELYLDEEQRAQWAEVLGEPPT